MTKKGALLRPLAYGWFRGPAARDRDVIVMDGRRAERYQPEDHPHIGLDLAKVKTPDDAVAFVERYGVLSRLSSLEFEPCPPEVREPFANFETTAEELRRDIRTVIDVRNAVKGDQQALDRVRALRIRGPDDHAADDRTMLTIASDWAAQGLANRLLNTHLYVFDPAQRFPDRSYQPGDIRVGVIGPTLLDYCYLSVAHALASEPIATCEECQCAFVVEDGRQKYCDAACASRARFRRFKTRSATKAAKKTHKRTTRGSKRGTRTR